MDALLRSGGALAGVPTWSQFDEATVWAPAPDVTLTMDKVLVAITKSDKVNRRSDKTERDMSLRESAKLDGNACDYRQAHRRPRHLSANFNVADVLSHVHRQLVVVIA
jgi:hypothetical protein